jgi:hypothetical protein
MAAGITGGDFKFFFRNCSHVWMCVYRLLGHVRVPNGDVLGLSFLFNMSTSALRLFTKKTHSVLSHNFNRSFSTSLSRPDFHFDTHHFVQRLEREGLNRAQAEGIMSAMAEVIDESIRNMTSNMVTKAEQEKVSKNCISVLHLKELLLPASLYSTS